MLRKNRSMTLAELQATLCDGGEKAPAANLRKWLGRLVAAGVMEIARMDDGKPTSNGSYRYTVVRNLGPKAPVVRARGGGVFDPNSGETIPPNPPQQRGGIKPSPARGGDKTFFPRAVSHPPLEKGGRGDLNE